MGADPKPTVGEVMRHVADLEAATTPEAKNIARSLIALKVAALSGESMQAAFEALRPVPEKAQTMGNIGGRAVKPVPTAPMKDAPLEQVVEGLVAKLELVPVKCATFSPESIPADVRARMDADRKAAELEDVPWGNAS